MKLIMLVCTLSIAIIAQGQSSSVARTDTGRIGGAYYQIDVPANWNRKLVMYAHGYETIGSSTAGMKANLNQVGGLFLPQGFAVARSAYRRQGWAVVEGVDDTEALRQYFVKQYGKPDTTFITGHSMGGMITLATIEKYPEHYQGAMPMCPLSANLYQSLQNHLFTMLVTFDALFPNTLALSKLASNEAKPTPPPVLMQKMQTDTTTAKQFARRFEVHYSDLPGVLYFLQEIYRDISQQVGGNPFDNTNSLYGGFLDDTFINRNVVRMTASAKARSFLGPFTTFTGKISDPVLLMHTLYDQLIPLENATGYDATVRQVGNDQLFVMKFTNGQGHCSFTPAQTVVALNQLRAWVATGKKPAPGEIK